MFDLKPKVLPTVSTYYCSVCRKVLAKGTVVIEVTALGGVTYTFRRTVECCGKSEIVSDIFEDESTAWWRIGEIKAQHNIESKAAA